MWYQFHLVIFEIWFCYDDIFLFVVLKHLMCIAISLDKPRLNKSVVGAIAAEAFHRTREHSNYPDRTVTRSLPLSHRPGTRSVGSWRIGQRR